MVLPKGTVALALAAVSFVASKTLIAATHSTTAPNVTYVASGTFATPATKGTDLFQLAGHAFSISVVANASTPPTTHGAQWAQYTKLKLVGTVSCGLESSPIAISSSMASIELATGNPSYDVFALFAPINVIGIQINVVATVQMPKGTLVNALIHPFTSTSLAPADSVVYSDPTSGTSTTLTIARGTLVATIPGSPTMEETPAAVQLHAEGAEAITAHTDGTKSVHPIGAAPVDLGGSSDTVTLEFYASGVQAGSEMHAWIASEEVPVLYAGPAGHFPGLSQVILKVPRSLAGSGDADVAMTVDSRPSNTVHIHIQ